MVSKRDDYYNWLFDEVHKKLGGKGPVMPPELKQAIKRRITSDQTKIGRKYTLDDMIKSMYAEMSKYAPSPPE